MLVIKRFILLVCALIISLVFLEFVSQLFFPVSNDFWRHDKDLGYSLIPGKEGRYISQDFDINVKINSQGFRDVERDFYNKDSFRILVVRVYSVVWIFVSFFAVRNTSRKLE